MVDLIHLFDFLFIVLVLYFSKYAYEKKYYIKFFEYFKIFVVIYLASFFAPYMGSFLQKVYLLQADTYITLLILSFGLNLFLLYTFWNKIIKVIFAKISTHKIKEFFAKVLSLVEVLIISTLGVYLIMQLYLSKVYFYKGMEQTYFYPYIEKFYIKFLNEDILAILQGSNTGTNSKELLYKSFTNAF